MFTHDFFDHPTDGCKYIRTKVFVEEQKFTDEFDENELTAHHLLISDGEKPAATARLLPLGDEHFLVGRVAVLPEYRKRGLGEMLLSLCEERARGLGGTVMEVSAQCRAREFYEKCGYVASGEVYLDQYCEHIHMEKTL